MDNKKLYHPENAGSGQYCNCAKCGLPPTPEGHDGCLGTLPGPIMNACCGHGNDRQAYIQYWESEEGGERVIVDGCDAVKEMERLKGDNQDKPGYTLMPDSDFANWLRRHPSYLSKELLK